MRRFLSAAIVLAVLAAAGCGGEEAPKRPAADAPQRATPTPRQVVLSVDGRKTTITTAAATVRAALAQVGVQLGRYHLVEPALDAPPGTQIKVVRLLSAPVTRRLPIAQRTIEKKNARLTAWSEKVLRPGRPGIRVVQIAYVRRNGKKVRAIVAQQITRRPVTRVVAVGPRPTSTGGAAARLNWRGLAGCESHNNPKAVNSAGGYYGLYQFSQASWASVGGTGLPSEATPAEQTYRAQLLYNRVQGRWQGQWPHCGRFLFS
ncbi:G5 domain-containing protein [Actinomadura craniellae]|uniref:G5 domain-containing protein n=1 Tax=Actinomadura craniellae TaxID=2231787 RepID=A0A365GZG7_9ACTN|nr:resuscitation-promoting factor [Actinomadura craniellae]RAY12229.1 G5 domain-containing protein [Actinomadura craniellae]